MAILNYVKREIIAKIVYYGPGLSGKTANIQQIHESMDPANVGELTSLATESDRTLFFDFVPIQLGSIAGLNTRFQLFTVPGQVFYNNTRRKVLEDADGVVFVADSQPEQLENNIESLNNLEENLKFYGKKMGDVPFVLQFNKQDLPGVMTEEELNKVLNKWNIPSIRASCIEGFGVMETLAKVSTMVLAHLREQMTRKSSSGGPPQGIKRTYSKEGISDEQVVKNMLEDIAASGGAAEAKAAAEAEAKEAKAAAAPRPPPPKSTAAPPTAPRPAAPARPPAAPAKPATPVPSKTSPMPVAAGPSLSAEDLLSDIEVGAATATTPIPKQPVAREVVSRPLSKPSPSAPPRPPPKMSSAPVTPAAAPETSGSVSRLKPAVPNPGSKQPGAAPNLRPSSPPAGLRGAAPAKTAEEMLESIDLEDRSAPGPMEQAGAGSFTASSGGSADGLWQDDGPTSANAVPAGTASKANLFGMESLIEAEERNGIVPDKTEVKMSTAGRINLDAAAPAIPADEPAPEPSFGRRNNGKSQALDPELGEREQTAPPVEIVQRDPAYPAGGAVSNARANLALAFSFFNLLLMLAMAAFLYGSHR